MVAGWSAVIDVVRPLDLLVPITDGQPPYSTECGKASGGLGLISSYGACGQRWFSARG
jgi:hypothetical protein